MESLKKEMEKQENDLSVQKSTLEAQQSATQQLLQGVEELRLAQQKGDSRIQTIISQYDEVLRGPRLATCSGGNSEERVRKNTVERKEP